MSDRKRGDVAVGLILMVIGLVPAGMVADYLVENHLSSALRGSFAIAHRTLQLSQPQLVLAGFVLGVAGVIFVLLGVGLLRGSWGRRRNLKQRIDDLQMENTKLRSRERLSQEVQASEANASDA
jgi:flagellar biosynthesis component FlhA